jgi:hypothetical protein
MALLVGVGCAIGLLVGWFLRVGIVCLSSHSLLFVLDLSISIVLF